MTKQEYYELLVKSATDGTFPAVRNRDHEGKSPVCQYRGPNGTKCAVGVIMPDSVYREEFDTHIITIDNLSSEVDLTWIPEGMDVRDLQTVQAVHDRLGTSPPWRPASFVRGLNELPCFSEVTKTLPENIHDHCCVAKG